MLSYFKLSRVLLSFWRFHGLAKAANLAASNPMSISKSNLRSMVSCVSGATRVAKSVEGPFAEGSAVYICVAWNSALAA